VNSEWKKTIAAAKEQNCKLSDSMDRSTTLQDGIADLNAFLDHLSADMPSCEEPVTQPSELSQRTYKLLQLKDRAERKRNSVLERVVRASEGLKKDVAVVKRVDTVNERWAEVTGPLETKYDAMKEVSKQKILRVESAPIWGE
jgi:hypothetical protein